jgi:type IV secretory pathway VirB10-like protein
MMSRNQRLSFLGIAAVIAVAAIVIFAIGRGDDGEEAAGTAATATATATPSATEDAEGTATPTPTPTPTPEPPPPLLQSGEVTELRFTEGETVRFRARSEETEEIHVHGYDRYVDLPAGKTVTESFKGSITGIFEIELHGSGEQIGELRVDPK